MPWRRSLPKPIRLIDGRDLKTLGDVGDLLTGDTFAGVPRSPAIERALELLLKASQTGDLADIQAAVDQAETVLSQHKLVS